MAYLTLNMFDHAGRIAELLKKYGWNQVELAKKTGISQQQISKILAAKHTQLKLETVEKIAKAFRMSVDEYLGKKPEKKPEKLHPLTIRLQKLLDKIPDDESLITIIESIIDREIDKESKG